MKSAVPSAEEVVVQMLAAGDWQCALELLEQGEGDLRHQRELIDNWRAGKNGLIDLDLTDRSQLHRTIQSSLGDLPQEIESKIAEKLIEADRKWNCSVMPRSQSPR
jgi:hypothetical protein